MTTLTAIKNWSKENRIDGYEDAYTIISRAVRLIATYTPGGSAHGIPAVLPTKAAACDKIASAWGITGDCDPQYLKFRQQCIYIARELEIYYTNKGV